jgi:hypothetical protein
MRRHAQSAAVALAPAAWFLANTWRGLLVPFTNDDLMNLYGAWTLPAWKLFVANLSPFTAVYRPLGSAFYRIVYLCAGLHPLPFRVVTYALMLVNVWLVYRLAKMLTRSAELALLAALLWSHHKRLMNIYLNNGTVYDVLCVTFFCLALELYISSRERCGGLYGWRIAAFFALFVLALNSKEMAVTLPAILFAYELIYHPPESSWIQWLLRRRAAVIAALMAIVATYAKTSPHSSFAGVPGYAVHLSAGQFLVTTRLLIAQLFLLPLDALTNAQVIVLFAVVWTIAIASGSKALRFAAAFLTLAPLPVNFIPARGFFAMYLPYIGWAMLAAVALVGIKDRLPVAKRSWATPALMLAAAAAVLALQSGDQERGFDQLDNMQIRIGHLTPSLARIAAGVPRDGKILFLNDAFPADSFAPMWAAQLRFRSAHITVDRAKFAQPSSESYDLVLDLCGEDYCSTSASRGP